MSSQEDRLRRLAHQPAAANGERPPTLFAAVVMVSGIPVDIPVQRPTADLVRLWMAREHEGRLVEGVHYWITPATFGGL